MDLRQYVHDDRKATDLFVSIVNHLSRGESPAQMISDLLKDVCAHFRFGCGLVYEADHTGNFLLKESHSVYARRETLRESFRLEEQMTPEEIGLLKADRLSLARADSGEDRGPGGLASLFGARSILITPVIMEPDGALAGLVAMLDRRRKIFMNEASAEAARVVLKLLANHIKTRLVQKNLTFAYQAMDSMLDHMGIDIYVNDLDTHEIIYLNRSMAEPYGDRDKMIGRKCWEALYDDKSGECDFCPRKKLFDDDGRPTRAYGWDYQRPFDGAWFRVLSAAFPWMDGRLVQVISSVDITGNKRNEETIFRLAFFDALTGLPNRRKLVLDLEAAFGRLRESGGHLWLIFFDLDKFKQVNDRLGHQAGDELLALIGRALDEHPDLRGRGYRLGGDEFVAFYENADRARLDNILNWLLKRFDEPWVLNKGRPVCRASIGVARYPDDGLDPEALLHQADLAMYQAKEGGRGQAAFTTGERRFAAGGISIKSVD